MLWLKWFLVLYFGLHAVLMAVPAVVVVRHLRRAGLGVVARWLAASAVAVVARLLAVPLVPVAVLLMRRTGGTREVWVDAGNGAVRVHAPAYRVPRVLSWLETFDDGDGALPGGTYELRVRSIYQRWGVRAASLYWLLRNRAYAVLKAFEISAELRYWLEHQPRLHAVDVGPLLVACDATGRPLAFEWRWHHYWGAGKWMRFAAGWKLRDFVDGDGQLGGGAGILQPPTLRPLQSE